ncbi:MAG: C_GCAxxG_C_C family protein [Deltaproteobacteria bacterium]|nr:C_GCAxxG_C_C family protein [Deltaproteobacteria bacterium]
MVSLSLKDIFNLKCNLIPNIATGFSGGIGRAGSVCGALVGAIMVVGIMKGRSQGLDQEALQKCSALSKRIIERFIDEFGSERCQDITGYLLSDPAQYRKWLENGGKEKCIDLVKSVTLFSAEIMKSIGKD